MHLNEWETKLYFTFTFENKVAGVKMQTGNLPNAWLL
jgi:hypothetical protein